MSVYEGVIHVLTSGSEGNIMLFNHDGNTYSMQDAKNVAPGMAINWYDLVINKANGAIYTINMLTSQILKLTK